MVWIFGFTCVCRFTRSEGDYLARIVDQDNGYMKMNGGETPAGDDDDDDGGGGGDDDDDGGGGGADDADDDDVRDHE